MYQNLPVRIHSFIADGGNGLDSRGYAAIALWYLCRAIDTKGAGWAEFRVADAASSLSRSPATIRRQLEDGQRLGFFRAVDRRYGRARVFYSSIANVAIRQGLMQLGSCGEALVSELRHIKAVATEIHALTLQKCSGYLARQDTARGQKRKVVTADALLKASSNSQGANVVVHRGGRVLFVSPEAVLSGASQKHIASTIGRSDRTIRNRLSNQWRTDRGLPPLLKRQLAQSKPEYDAIGFQLSENGVGSRSRYFVLKGSTWRLGCNLYGEGDRSLSTMKAGKYFYRREVEAVLSEGGQELPPLGAATSSGFERGIYGGRF